MSKWTCRSGSSLLVYVRDLRILRKQDTPVFWEHNTIVNLSIGTDRPDQMLQNAVSDWGLQCLPLVLQYLTCQQVVELRNRAALAVICWVINHCLEVSCKVDQITSAEREWFIFLQLADKVWFITQQITHKSWSISILTHRKRRKCNCIL